MESERRCTIFPHTPELSSGFQETQPVPQPDTSAAAAKLQKRLKPARLPLPVKRPADDSGESSKRRPLFAHDGSPWEQYQKLQHESTKGKTYLAFEKASPGNIVAIREYMIRADETPTKHLFRTSHTNLVNLVLLFTEPEKLYFVYERMDITLEQLASAVRLKEPQIAFLCKETLQGLSYIHEELHISHGGVKSDNVFLTLNGQVKLGNVAMPLLHQRTGFDVDDVKSVGMILKEVVEPGDFQKCPDSRVLKYPVDWSDHIRTFLAATQKSRLRDLLNHDFLLYAGSPGCLAPLVFVARKSTRHSYE